MRQAPTENSKPVRGVIATVTAGFELTTSNPWLIAFPILIDLIYWLGPRLSIEQLAEQTRSIIAADPGLSGMAEQFTEMAAGYNLFTALSVPLVGVPALMGGVSPEKTPLTPVNHTVASSTEFLGLFALLTLMGLLLAAVYLSFVALALDKDTESPKMTLGRAGSFAKSAAIAWFRLLIMGIFLVVTIFVILVPLVPLAYLMAFLSEGLAMFVLVIGIVIVVTYLSMAIPGIVVDRQPVGIAIVSSVRIVRRYLLPTMNLLLVVVLIGLGTNLLWHMADSGNWLTLISIAGHGFVSTALAASIFIFYRDRSIYRQVQGI